jgi:hypothetical protein
MREASAVNVDAPVVSKGGKPVNFSTKDIPTVHMMNGTTPRDLAQWRHLVLKLRWIGLEHEARRLQSIVGSMHLKAELARHPQPPILMNWRRQTRKHERAGVPSARRQAIKPPKQAGCEGRKP